MIVPTQLFRNLKMLNDQMYIQTKTDGSVVLGTRCKHNVISCQATYNCATPTNSTNSFQISPLYKLTSNITQMTPHKTNVEFHSNGIKIIKNYTDFAVVPIPPLDLLEHKKINMFVGDLRSIVEVVNCVDDEMSLSIHNRKLVIRTKDNSISKTILVATKGTETVMMDPSNLKKVCSMLPENYNTVVSVYIKTDSILVITYNNYTFYIAPRIWLDDD